MDTRVVRSRVLFASGLVALLLGTLDPLEAAWLIFVGAAALHLAAFLGDSRRVSLFSWALPLIAIGVLALHSLSWAGGFGGRSGRSIWWGLLLLPYAIGWLLALVAALLEISDHFRRSRMQRA